MPRCPNCNCTYNDEMVCKYCGFDLTKNKSNSEYEYEKFLTEASNELEAQMIMNTLKNANIPCIRKYPSSGDLMKVYGFVNFSSKIYVPQSAYEKAKELVGFAPPEMDDTNDIDYEQPVQTTFFKRETWFNILFWIINGIIILVVVFLLIDKMLAV